MTLTLGYLCDHPAAAPVLARWHWQEWATIIPRWSEAEALAELRTHTRRRHLPTTIVAYDGAELVGSASLLAEDMPDFPPLSPWLASVFVRPDRRGKGLGQALARRVLLEAAALGHARVYLFTTDQAGWYARMGWQVEQACASGGHPGVIMATDTARHGASF